MKKTFPVVFGAIVRAAALPMLLLFARTVAAQSGIYDWNNVPNLGSYPGIQHVFVSVAEPRKMNIHCLRIDTAAPGLRFATTPRCDSWEPNDTETRRQTTRKFVEQSRSTDKKLATAVNADAFALWGIAWSMEAKTDLQGLAVCEGTLVSPGSGSPSLLVKTDGTVGMAATGADFKTDGVQTAVSGFAFVLTEGNAVPGQTVLHPRTGIGLSRDGRYVYLLTIDGRQPSSEGATTEEVGVWLKHFGAFTGINMDGGGSTTLAWWNPQTNRCELLNTPVGDGKNPGQGERCNGNNLGVYYEKE